MSESMAVDRVEETKVVEVKVESISLPAKVEVEDTPNASVKRVCGVCNEQEGKYKCTRCEIP